MLQRELLYAAMGTGFTCGATILGAAMVFFFKKDISDNIQKVFLGFAAGVMIAASVWSLLIPAMEMAESLGQNVLLPVGGGFELYCETDAPEGETAFLPPQEGIDTGQKLPGIKGLGQIIVGSCVKSGNAILHIGLGSQH